MAQQEEGWPLGLQPLNVRVGLGRNHDFSGSVSFNTLHTGSPTSSTDSSSDLDTESTGSFFHDKSITLGSLIGVSSILELSKRSVRGIKKTETLKEKKSNHSKSKIWFLSLCIRDKHDTHCTNNAPSLGHFLAVERKAADEHRRNASSILHGHVPDELAMAPPSSEPNSLFVNGYVAPPQARGRDIESRENGEAETGNGLGLPALLSCLCGQSSE